MKLLNILLKESIESLSEVRYINPKNIDRESPIKDSETLRVYHGFNNFKDVENIMKNGLSGKERAKRIYSYEAGNNPYGLFVTLDFDVIKRAGFAHSGVIIEFSTKVSDLEAPVWVGGRSYFVAGEYTKSFKDLEEREQQRLINRQKAEQSPYDAISKSDRAEVADTIFDNPERQALYIGNLNPNMIKYVWYNEVLHKQRRTNGDWIRMTRKDFINKLKIDTKQDRYFKYLPNDEFDIDQFVETYFKGDYTNKLFVDFVEYYSKDEYKLKQLGLWPKQINKILQMSDDGLLDKYVVD